MVKWEERTNLSVELVKKVRDLLGAKVFVETGTGLGRTSALMSEEFDVVMTLEASDERFSNAVEKFDGTNVVPIHGESPESLRKHVVGRIKQPIIFFLDAHCPYRELCSYSECVLDDELRDLARFEHPCAIFIDDVDWFITPPPIPRDRREEWPDLVEIVDIIREIGDFFIFVWKKNLVAVPVEMKEQVSDYLVEVRQ
jgi:hypothetical protein